MYASLYRHDTLTKPHDNLHELFGESNIETFEHLALIVRKGHLVDFKGNDVYMPHFERLTMPICFISGAKPVLPAGKHAQDLPAPGQSTARNITAGMWCRVTAISTACSARTRWWMYPIILEHLEKRPSVDEVFLWRGTAECCQRPRN
jgi:cholesterol oxidase